MIIGLTGSIASGKSTISELLKSKGFPIVDADKIAHLVVEPGSPVLKEIELFFGKEMIKTDGSLNREKLGERIFRNENDRNKLNSIIHPAIRAEMLAQKEKWLLAGANTVIMDIPLLFESKLQHFVEKIIVVSVTPEIQKQRLMSRNKLTAQDAAIRIQSQLPMDLKEKGADAIIYNNGTIEESEQQLNSILFNWNAQP
ncbi:dephospho-CoA kinase [Sporosarcina siberiensis]|uniref:Dephospho-CoA kinase n=1 Tax=Sporosarcina siberiensis TaxID=1365606 RepID=A0ABW4SEE5_9BACL